VCSFWRISLFPKTKDIFISTLFEPLTDCEFKEYNFDFSSQAYSFSHMTPFHSQGSQPLSQDDMIISEEYSGNCYNKSSSYTTLRNPL